MFSMDFLEDWLRSMTEPEKSWKGAYMDERQAKAFHNVRNFLRSLSEAIRRSKDMPQEEIAQSAILVSLDNLKPY